MKIKITDKETAIAVGSGDLPVLATPVMIALMEHAAMKEAMSYCDETQTTVGTVVDIKHTRATPVGDEVETSAQLVERDGRRLVFQVTARDSEGDIGVGKHERFIVDRERFMSKIVK